MSMWPSAPSASDILPWREAFLSLAIEPLNVFFSEMGLPAGMSEDPRALTAASRQFLKSSKEESGVTPQWDSVHQRWELDPTGTLRGLIQRAFQRLAEAYGTDQAQQLRDWATRHFVDSRSRENLWLWSVLFPSLLDDTAERSSSALLPQTASRSDLREAVAKWFGPDILNLGKQQLREARRVPLSEEEHALLQLEVTSPTDLPEWDVFGLVQQVLESERAYRTWRDVQSRLDKNDQDALLQWGHAEARRRGMPTEQLAPP